MVRYNSRKYDLVTKQRASESAIKISRLRQLFSALLLLIIITLTLNFTLHVKNVIFEQSFQNFVPSVNKLKIVICTSTKNYIKKKEKEIRNIIKIKDITKEHIFIWVSYIKVSTNTVGITYYFRKRLILLVVDCLELRKFRQYTISVVYILMTRGSLC